MRPEYISELRDKGLLNGQQHALLWGIYSEKIISLFNEIRIALYLGVVLFSTGTGILIYKYSGEYMHIINLGLLTLSMAGCFIYAFRKKQPYSHREVKSPSPYFDYILLLGAIIFMITEGYLQYLYNVFGSEWGLAGLIAAGLCFFLAFTFDHRGALSLAITSAASAIGLQITAAQVVRNNVFSNQTLIAPAIIFGVVTILTGFLLDSKQVKKHFTFSYLFWGALILLSAFLSALFEFDTKILNFLLLMLVCALSAVYANRSKSYIFLLFGVVFGYVGTTYFISSILKLNSPLFWYAYFIVSCACLIFFIINSVKIYSERKK